MLPIPEKMNSLITEIQEFLIKIETESSLSIHGIRKRTKFLRALLKLQSGSPPGLNRSVKKVSRFLASYRDAQINLDIYHAITDSSTNLKDPELETMLRQNPFYLKQYPEPSIIKTMQTLLTEFTEQLNTSALDLSPNQIFQGIKHSFESGTKALENVRVNSESNIVHTWRKMTKQLWYQLRLIFSDEQEALDHPLVLSNNLGKQLGEIHDLDFFMILLNPGNNSNLRKAIQEKRQQLLSDVMVLGDVFYIKRSPDLYQLLKQTL